MNLDSIFYMLDLVYKGNPSSTHTGHSHFSAPCFTLQESQTSTKWIFVPKFSNRLGISVLPPSIHEVSACIVTGASSARKYANKTMFRCDFQPLNVSKSRFLVHTLLRSIMCDVSKNRNLPKYLGTTVGYYPNQSGTNRNRYRSSESGGGIFFGVTFVSTRITTYWPGANR